MDKSVTTSSDVLSAALRRRIDRVLTPLIAVDQEVALLGYPNHENCGDSAIWVGERAWLHAHGAHAAYIADAVAFSGSVMGRRAPKRHTILLHGGGNLGDLWPEHQAFREQVIAAYPDHRIVQLPQTIHFQSPSSLKRTKAVFDAHEDLTLLLRDERSLAFAREHFRAASELCPDMAFAITGLERSPPRHDVVWLARTDAEARPTAAHQKVGPMPLRLDWPPPAQSGRLYPRLRNATTSLGRALHDRPWLHPAVHPTIVQMYDALAAERLGAGVRTLSLGSTVITDRLHGHILCLQLGIPHVLVDNSYGKLSGFHTTWTHGSMLTRWAATSAEALELARA